MPVTSTPLAQPKEREKGKAVVPPWALVPLALVGVVGGIAFWLFGARYTIDGIINGCNLFLSFFTIPYQIEKEWRLYLWLMPFPIFFSVIEQFVPPFKRISGKVVWMNFWWIVVWCLVSGADLITTGYGLNTSTGGPKPIHDLAQTAVGLGVMCAVLTFAPERLLRAMINTFWRALGSMWG